MSSLPKPTQDLLIKYIFREYDLPLEEYLRLISQPLSDSQNKILQKWIERIYKGIIAKKEDSVRFEDLDFSELVILQRWSIDVGAHRRSLEVFKMIASKLGEQDMLIRQWVVFLAGKAHQHLGEFELASFFYAKVSEEKVCDDVLNLYLDIEKAYLAFHKGQHRESYDLIHAIGTKFDLFDNKWLHIKVLCNYAFFLYAFGQMAEAIKILRHILSFKSIAKTYKERCELYLFQIYVETYQFSAAEDLLHPLIDVFYLNESDDSLSFCIHWIRFLQMTNHQSEANRVQSEVERRLISSAMLSHQMTFWADCKLLSSKEIRQCSQRARAVQDTYSRCYLWLKQIHMNHLILSAGKKNRLLGVLEGFFRRQYLFFDLKLIEAMQVQSKNRELTPQWVEDTLAMGHGYLLHQIAKVASDRILIFTCQGTNSLYFSSGEIVRLGKDSNSIQILTCMTQECVEVSVVITQAFGDREVSIHSLQKLQTAVHRLNKRLAIALLSVSNQAVTLNKSYQIRPLD